MTVSTRGYPATVSLCHLSYMSFRRDRTSRKPAHRTRRALVVRSFEAGWKDCGHFTAKFTRQMLPITYSDGARLGNVFKLIHEKLKAITYLAADRFTTEPLVTLDYLNGLAEEWKVHYLHSVCTVRGSST